MDKALLQACESYAKVIPLCNISEQVVRVAGIEFCRPASDDSPVFSGIPSGACIEVDGILYVKESEWLSFLYSLRDQVINA